MSLLLFVSAKFLERRLILFIAGTVFEDGTKTPILARPCLTKYWKKKKFNPTVRSALLFSFFCIPNFADQIHQDPGPLLCPLALSQVYSFHLQVTTTI